MHICPLKLPVGFRAIRAEQLFQICAKNYTKRQCYLPEQRHSYAVILI